MTELTEMSMGRPVAISLGEEIRVALKENGTTGYKWTVGTECAAILHPERERAIPAAEARPGAGGSREWVYKAVGVGECELRFALGRSWERAETAKVVSFPVTVRKK